MPRRLVTGNIIPHLSIRCCCRHHGWSRWWQHLWVVRPSVRQPGERGGGRGAARPLETDGCRRTDGRTRGMKTVSSRMDWWREAEGKVSRRARMEGELKSFWRAERMVAPPPQLNTKASATSPPLTPLTPRTLSSAEGFYHISGSGDQVSTCYILVPGSQQHLSINEETQECQREDEKGRFKCIKLNEKPCLIRLDYLNVARRNIPTDEIRRRYLERYTLNML